MPTRQGWTILFAAIAASVLGRVFGVLELFVIGVAMATAVVVAVVLVQLFPSRLSISRWIQPTILTVGEVGRVDLLIENRSRVASPLVKLIEPVGPKSTAQLHIAPIPARRNVTAGYRVPADRRGITELGPTLIDRRDVLGIASMVRIAAGPEQVVIAPRTIDIGMPDIGSGILGRHMLALAQRLGPGEFHSLRDYVPGDEPRSIHWKASARTDGLKVRQHETQGLQRCMIVLDADMAAYQPYLAGDPDVFERAVSIAASIVVAAERRGLTTRFVAGPMCDLRGSDVATRAMPFLARIQLAAPIGQLERDPGEGIGLMIVVTASSAAAAWSRLDSADPAISKVGAFTGASSHGLLNLDATSVERFRFGWQRLIGEVTPQTREMVANPHLTGHTS